jgi:iron(III) transport system ATP-binding protein
LPQHVLSVNNLTKIFETDQGEVLAVDRVSFELSGDEFFTMLGPSGCGKTTTLRMISGLEAMTSGSIFFDGQDFSGFSSFQRNIGMVFQSYALFPHMTVFENTAYGLRVRGMAAAELDGKIGRILDLLGLGDLAKRYPADLSGGQQQRVSIGRALVYDPGMLLLDEPLANLDAKLRVEMREEIRRIQKELGIMSIYVTHDQEEAMSISDRVAVFNLGRLMQEGPPEEIYADPTSLFVADFIGKANFFPARIAMRDNSGAKVSLASGAELALERLNALMAEEEAELAEGFDATVMVRPEHVTIDRPGADGLICRVRRIQFLGSFIRYMVTSTDASREIIVDSPRAVAGLEEGGDAALIIDPTDMILFHEKQAR